MVALTLAAGLTLACGEPGAGDRLVIGEARDVGVLLPAIEGSALDGEINSMLYLRLNSAWWEDGAIAYGLDELSLAQGYEFGGDSTTLTYELRPDATWSDGEPITADDVVFTYELIRLPEIASPYVDTWEHLDSVTAVGPGTVTFHFQRRYPGMLFDTGVGIMPRHVYAEAASDAATLAAHPALVEPGGNLVVSGPYRVAEWQQGDRLMLTANPRAFTVQPQTDTVIFRVIPDETTRLVELENGDLDVAGPLPLARAEELAAGPEYRAETVDDRFYDYIAWNPSGFGAFAAQEVRAALSLAIDREAILAGLGIADYARPAAGPYPPIFHRLADLELRPDPHAPDSARALLATRGWRDHDGDGVLDRDGTPFRFDLLTQAGNRRRLEAAEIIQAQYAEIGIEMRVEPMEFNALLDRVFGAGDFQAVLLGWQVALEPDYLVGPFWPADHPYNFVGYTSAALDSLIPLAQAAPSAELAAPFWRRAARVVARERPYAFLWFYDDVVLVSERVRNTRIDTYGLYQNLHEWTVER